MIIVAYDIMFPNSIFCKCNLELDASLVNSVAGFPFKCIMSFISCTGYCLERRTGKDLRQPFAAGISMSVLINLLDSSMYMQP